MKNKETRMICNEPEYRTGLTELGRLIEQEDSLDAAALRHMSDLADALIAFEQALLEAEGTPRATATPEGKREYVAAKRGERILITA